MKHKNSILLFAILLVLAVLSRLISHYWNFTVLGGAFLLAGAYFQDKKVAITLMLSVLLISDAVIGFHANMPSVYLAYLVMVGLGALLKVNSSRAKVFGTSLLATTLFFLITNFAVWYEGILYPTTVDGLLQCYKLGLPFYRNQLLGDVLSALVFFEVARHVLAPAPQSAVTETR